MGYKSETVATTIKHLNQKYFLPAIQREFVWGSEKVIQLFDSVLRGYPISSFLYWNLEKQNREKWQVYEFIENAKESGVHNEEANMDGRQEVVLVLDGQQRLTSLFVGLRGTFAVKRKYKWKNNPDAWSMRRLFIDLLKNPFVESEDLEEGIRYGLEFLEKPPKSDNSHLWFKIGNILDFDGQDKFDKFMDDFEEKLPESLTKGQIKIVRSNLERMYRAFWKDEPIAYHVEMDQEYDRVLDIFVRANDGGVKLSKSDLLLSMVTAKWEGTNARKEIYDFVDQINRELTRRNNLSKDFVLKTALVLSELPVKYKVENFSDKNLDTIRDNWKEIKKSITAGVDLVNSFGFDENNLTSANALIPVIYYIYKLGGLSLQKSSQFEARNADRIRRWLTISLLNNVFGGASDTLLAEARNVIRDANKKGRDFPDESLSKIIARIGRKGTLDAESLENLLHIEYGDRECFLALSLLYDERAWGSQNFHIDHIFPRDLFDKKALAAIGLSGEEQKQYRERMNSLANLELLQEKENLEKSAKPFKDWLKTRDDKFLNKQLIPTKAGLFKFDSFLDFLKAREELILERLRSLVADSSK